jgi:3-hydroxybutyryl-CoA dehydratase
MNPTATSQASALLQSARISFEFAVTAKDMDGFARISGDRNPLHLDDAHARERGFSGRVVYGGLLIAKVSRLIGMELPTANCVWNGVKLDFRRPLYVGETAWLQSEVTHVAPAVRAATIGLRITVGERLIAKGIAEVTYFDA